ncbi:MAG TPA: histidine kinase N-terminal 7TM domain-containing protein [Anaerolineales bacterium]|nr:histidine kinase N-terminal 7TM domain-containing protein [Anaerolineales bacterium]
MNRTQLLYLAPYLLSLVLLAGIFLYALRHRYVRGARIFTWLIAGQILTTLGFIFELLSSSLETKILWDTFQWLTGSFLVILPFLVFAVQFSEHKLRSPALTWGLILTFLGVFATLLLTDYIHHLFYSTPRLTADSPFPELKYDFTFVLYVYLLFYVYGANFYGIALLIRRAFQPHNLFRLQYLIIAGGFLIPLIFSFFPLVEIQITPQRDITPIASALGSLIVAWGLFRYGLFDIAPLAREQVIANLSDPVIVLDPRNRIIDINQAALRLIEKQSPEVIGRTTDTVFAKRLFLLELVNYPFEQRKEIPIRSEGKTLFFDISISHILDPKRVLIGRVITARDITQLKNLENNYRSLSEDLEQRIQKRTEELQTTAEHYRKIIENQTDFIVRWKPDGTRTFVNEAYCRYWGITYEQALAMNFLFHAVEEDRPAIEDKISRLNSGAIEVETEVHRVLKPDGSLAWQEWTDRAIRDDWGQLIEIQSIGRDITERKKAEENVA